MTLPPTNPADAITRLTPKERECLERWMNHATAKEIALDLGISHHAVEKRLKSARQKLGVATSLEAARLLAKTKGYGLTASQPPEVAASPDTEHHPPIGGTFSSQSPSLRRRPWIIGATIMSLTLLAALALTPQPAAEAKPPEVLVIDKRKDAAAQIAAAADQSFARLDNNGSGFLEGAELPTAQVRTVRTGRDAEAPPSTGSAKLAEADGDGDSRVSRAEYRAWLSVVIARSRS